MTTTLTPESSAADLPPLPPQPHNVPWPTEQWPRGTPEPGDPATFEQLCDGLFDLPPGAGVTCALLVERGQLDLYAPAAVGLPATCSRGRDRSDETNGSWDGLTGA